MNVLASTWIRVFSFFALLCSAFLLCSTTAQAQISHYRRVKGNMGNCIFSTSPLPHGRELRYRNIRKSFKVKRGLVLYARCYLPKKLKYYERKGRVFNQLRDQRRSETTWWFGGAKRASTKIATHPYRAKHGNWDQNYYYLGKVRGCNYCEDFLKMGKKLWTKPWERSREFCLMKTITFADSYKRQWKRTRRGVRQLMNKKLWILFRGCVTLRYPKS